MVHLYILSNFIFYFSYVGVPFPPIYDAVYENNKYLVSELVEDLAELFQNALNWVQLD